MSHYAYELQEATCLLHTDDFDELLNAIKKEIRKDKWSCYDWRNAVLKSETLERLAKEFGIELIPTHGYYVRPEIKDVYVSSFFDTLIDIVAPYMTNGKIKVDDEYGVETIKFRNGGYTIKRKDN